MNISVGSVSNQVNMNADEVDHLIPKDKLFQYLNKFTAKGGGAAGSVDAGDPRQAAQSDQGGQSGHVAALSASGRPSQ